MNITLIRTPNPEGPKAWLAYVGEDRAVPVASIRFCEALGEGYDITVSRLDGTPHWHLYAGTLREARTAIAGLLERRDPAVQADRRRALGHWELGT